MFTIHRGLENLEKGEDGWPLSRHITVESTREHQVSWVPLPIDIYIIPLSDPILGAQVVVVDVIGYWVWDLQKRRKSKISKQVMER